MRLGGQQVSVQIGRLAVAIRVPTELGTVGRLALPEQQVVRLALYPLAGLEAEGLSAGAPPAAGRFSPLSVAWM